MSETKENELVQVINEARRLIDDAIKENARGKTSICITILCAVIRALELMAVRLLALEGAKVEVKQEPAASVESRFDKALVERLARVAWNADARNNELPWKIVNDAAKENVRSHVRAVLSELASMPVELPTGEEIVDAWYGKAGPNGEMYAAEGGVRDTLRLRIAPILAAKDIELARLRDRIANHDAGREHDEKELAICYDKLNKADREKEQHLARIAELEGILQDTGRKLEEKETAMQNAEVALQLRCERHEARIAELEKEVADAKKSVTHWQQTTGLLSPEAVVGVWGMWVQETGCKDYNEARDTIKQLRSSLAREKSEYGNLIAHNRTQLESLAKRDERIAELERQVSTEKEKRRLTIESAKGDKKACEEHIAELESRLAPVDANGKTPGQVYEFAFLKKMYCDGGAPFTAAVAESSWRAKKDWERNQCEVAASAVLRAFGGDSRIAELEKQHAELLAAAKLAWEKWHENDAKEDALRKLILAENVCDVDAEAEAAAMVALGNLVDGGAR